MGEVKSFPVGEKIRKTSHDGRKGGKSPLEDKLERGGAKGDESA